MEIDFDTLKSEILKLLDKNNVMVLATCCNDRVTARAVSCVHKKLKLIFQTGKTSLKYEQMIKNKNVALCAANMQMEGIATFKGHSTAPHNKEFISLFKKLCPMAFERYSRLKDEVVVEVVPALITLWKYDEQSRPFRDILDISKKRACREYARIEE